MEQITEEKEIAALPTSNRFKEAPWFTPGISAIVGGAGGIGSWLCMLLARQETDFYVYDFDKVEVHNIGGQLFGDKDIGISKVDALAKNINDLCGERMECHYDSTKFDKDSMASEFMFSCFDNMTARKVMFDKWVEYVQTLSSDEQKKCLFVDGRMLAEQAQVYFVTIDRVEEYKKTLFDDSESPNEPCSYKSTSFCATMISSLMVSGFNNFIANMKSGMDIREIPFSIEYQLPLMNFKCT